MRINTRKLGAGWLFAARRTRRNLFSLLDVAMLLCMGGGADALAATCLSPPAGLVSWWAGEGDANDLWGANHGTLCNGARFAPGYAGQAFQFNAAATAYVRVANSPALNPTNITLSAWVKPFSYPASGSVIVRKQDSDLSVAYLLQLGDGITAGRPHFNCGIAAPQPIGPDPVPLNQWSFVVGTYDGVSAHVYVNAELVDAKLMSGPMPSGAQDLFIGQADANPGGNFDGLIDEVAIWNRSLSSEEISALYAAGEAGMCRPPQFSPTADFSISNGNPNGVWSYGWMPADFSNFNLDSHNESGYGGSPRWSRDAGGAPPSMWKNVTSDTPWGVPPGWLSLHPGPGTEPSVLRWTAPASGQIQINGRFLAGDGGSMRVAVRLNNQPLWQAGNEGVFDLSALVVLGDTVDFAVYGGYSYGNTPLDVTITLVPIEEPFISEHPASQMAAATRDVTLTVKAGGALPLNFQWFFNGTPLANATNATLLLPSVTTNQSGAYVVQVNNSFGTLTSQVAVLTVVEGILFGTNTTIAATNTTYDGKDIFVQRCTLTVEGEHSFQLLAVPFDGQVNYAGNQLNLSNLTLAGSSTFNLGGGAVLKVAEDILLASNATLVAQGKNTAGQMSNQWAGVGVTIQARNVNVAAGAKLSANGQGYTVPGVVRDGNGPAGGRSGGGWGSGGGGHGGAGANGDHATGGGTYGSSTEPIDLGSAGGSGDQGTPNGHGGGAIRLIVQDKLTLDGVISARGNDGDGDCAGGAGGSIWVTTGVLAGSGQFDACGGNAIWGAGGGGGGRIAVYYASSSFTGYTNSTASGGLAPFQSGGPGTLGFFDTSVPNHHLMVSQHYLLASDTQLQLGALTVTRGGRLVIGGGSVVQIAGEFNVVDPDSTVVCQSKNRSGLIDGKWLGAGVTIQAARVSVGSGAGITADGQGYTVPGMERDGNGPGGGRSGGAWGSGGGGHGGAGANGDRGAGGGTYGSSTEPIDLGSAGGSGNQGGPNGYGGGAIRLVVQDRLTLDGVISARGNDGDGDCAGGAGGSIWVTTGVLAGSGQFDARGGNAIWGGTAGGGGGRIAVYYASSSFTGFTNSTANGGVAPFYSGGPGTLGFFDTSVPNHHLMVWQHYLLAPDTQLQLGALTVTRGGRLVIGGGSVVQIAGEFDVVDPDSTVVCQSKNRSGLIDGKWLGAGVTIQAARVSVGSGAGITADGQGYTVPGMERDGNGPGGGRSGGAWGSGGGGHGGAGANGENAGGGGIYGSCTEPIDLGSAGGSGNQGVPNGNGGGAIRLLVKGRLTLDGIISARGNDGDGDCAGGAGGSIWVTTGVLAGSGQFDARGGNAIWGAGGGGGGRIAVYSASSSFTGYTNSTVRGGVAPYQTGQEGTLGFFDTAVPRHHLFVSHRFAFEQNTTAQLGAVTVLSGGTLLLGGGVTLNVDGHLNMAGSNAVLVCQSKNRSSQVNGVWGGAGVTINAENITVAAGTRISADGQGYTVPGMVRDGNGLGGGHSGGGYGSGGGGHGGAGANGDRAVGGGTYGSLTQPTDLGSAGGSGDQGTPSGHGGGAIRLIVRDRLTLDGIISARGNDADGDCASGAGGSLWINTGALTGAGELDARGGNAVWGAGGGGGGRIAIYAWNWFDFPPDHIHLGGGTTPSGRNGAPGTLHREDPPSLVWISPPDNWLHGVERLEWVALAVNPFNHQGTLRLFGEGRTDVLGQALPALGALDWDTTRIANGQYELRFAFFDSDATLIGEVSRRVLINNSVAWHAGTIATNETWSAGTVHVVEGPLVIGSGVTVTIQPGAVVKFPPGVQLTIQPGAVLNALGTSPAPIVLTSLADDTAGGDSNLDGARSVPTPGEWIFNVQGNGQLSLNEFAERRYSSAAYAGTLPADATWSGTFLHRITGDVLVPSGVTLTIQPGAVIKFDDKRGLVVSSGGRLVAAGTVAQPITFTSVKDDSVGGDTNGDGNQTTPAAGDWRWIYANGGQVQLDHSLLTYGAGTTSGNWDQTGVIRTSPGAVVTISNSIIREAFFEGVTAWQGGDATLVNSVIAGTDRAVNSDGQAVVRLLNCTLDGNRIGIWAHGGRVELVNSIISGSLETGIASMLGSAPTVRYCDVWSTNGQNYAGLAEQTDQNGNISVDPKYKDRERGNYRLNYRSPAIDAADGRAAPETDAMGAPRYDDPRSANTGLATASLAFADLGAFEFVETAPSDIDLVVSSITGPSEVIAGQEIQLEWTVANVGTGTASGPWHDTVYLGPVTDESSELLWAGEVLFGEGVVLGSGQSYTASSVVRVPGAAEGQFRWQIRLNSRGEVFEGANWTNNSAAATSPTHLTVSILTIGELALTNRFSDVGQAHWFKVVSQTNQDVFVSLDLAGAGGVSELYIGRGYLPTRQHFDVRQMQWNSADTSAVVPAAAAQTYYVLAYGPELQVKNTHYDLLAVSHRRFTPV